MGGTGWRKERLGPHGEGGGSLCHLILMPHMSQVAQHGFPIFYTHSIAGVELRRTIGATAVLLRVREQTNQKCYPRLGKLRELEPTCFKVYKNKPSLSNLSVPILYQMIQVSRTYSYRLLNI